MVVYSKIMNLKKILPQTLFPHQITHIFVSDFLNFVNQNILSKPNKGFFFQAETSSADQKHSAHSKTHSQAQKKSSVLTTSTVYTNLNRARSNEPICNDFLLILTCFRLADLKDTLRTEIAHLLESTKPLKANITKLKSLNDLQRGSLNTLIKRDNDKLVEIKKSIQTWIPLLKLTEKYLPQLYTLTKIICEPNTSTWKTTFKYLKTEDKLNFIECVTLLNNSFPDAKQWILKSNSFIHLQKLFFQYKSNPVSEGEFFYKSLPILQQHGISRASSIGDEKLLINYKDSTYISNTNFDKSYVKSQDQFLTELIINSSFVSTFFDKLESGEPPIEQCYNNYLSEHFPELLRKHIWELKDLSDLISHFNLPIELPEYDCADYLSKTEKKPAPSLCFVKQNDLLCLYIQVDLIPKSKKPPPSEMFKTINLFEIQTTDNAYIPDKLNILLKSFIENLNLPINNKELTILYRKNSFISKKKTSLFCFLHEATTLCSTHNFIKLKRSISSLLKQLKFVNIQNQTHLYDYKLQELSNKTKIYSAHIDNGDSELEKLTLILNDQEPFATYDWLKPIITKQNIYLFFYNYIHTIQDYQNLIPFLDSETLDTQIKYTSRQFDLLQKLFTTPYFNLTTSDKTEKESFLNIFIAQPKGVTTVLSWINDLDMILLQFNYKQEFSSEKFSFKDRTKIEALKHEFTLCYKRYIKTCHKQKNCFNLVISEFQSLIDQLQKNLISFSRGSKKKVSAKLIFTPDFIEKIDSFSKKHRLDFSEITNVILASFCLQNTNTAPVCGALILQLSQEPSRLNQATTHFFNTVGGSGKITSPNLASHVLYQNYITKFLYQVFNDTFNINLNQLNIDLNFSFILEHLEIDLCLPQINNACYSKLNATLLNAKDSKGYPLEIVLQVYSQFVKSNTQYDSQLFWDSFVNFKHSFEQIINSVIFDIKNPDAQHSIKEDLFFKEPSPIGNQLYRRSAPFFMTVFNKINTWFCTQVVNHLEFMPSNKTFEEFVNNILLKSSLDIRLFFLPIFLKCLNSAYFDRINLAYKDNIFNIRLQNLLTYFKIKPTDKTLNISRSEVNAPLLFKQLNHFKNTLDQLYNSSSYTSDISPVLKSDNYQIKHTKKDLENLQNIPLLFQVRNEIDFILSNFYSVFIGKTIFLQKTILTKTFLELIEKRNTLNLLQDKSQEDILQNELTTKIDDYKKEIEDNRFLYPSQSTVLHILEKPYSWELLALHMFAIHCLDPHDVSGKLRDFDILNKLIYERNIKRNQFSKLKSNMSSEKKIKLFTKKKESKFKAKVFKQLVKQIQTKTNLDNKKAEALTLSLNHNSIKKAFNIFKQKRNSKIFINHVIGMAIKHNNLHYLGLLSGRKPLNSIISTTKFNQLKRIISSILSTDTIDVLNQKSTKLFTQKTSFKKLNAHRIEETKKAISLVIETKNLRELTRYKDSTLLLEFNQKSGKNMLLNLFPDLTPNSTLSDISLKITNYLDLINQFSSNVSLEDIDGSYSFLLTLNGTPKIVPFLTADSLSALTTLIGPVFKTDSLEEIKEKAHTINLQRDLLITAIIAAVTDQDLSLFKTLKGHSQIVSLLPKNRIAELTNLFPKLSLNSKLDTLRFSALSLQDKLTSLTKCVNKLQKEKTLNSFLHISGTETIVNLLKKPQLTILEHYIPNIDRCKSINDIKTNVEHLILHHALKHNSLYLLSTLSGDSVVEKDLDLGNKANLAYLLKTESASLTTITLSEIKDLAEIQIKAQMLDTLKSLLNLNQTPLQPNFFHFILQFSPPYYKQNLTENSLKETITRHFRADKFGSELANQCLFSIIKLYKTLSARYLNGQPITAPNELIATNLENSKYLIEFLSTIQEKDPYLSTVCEQFITIYHSLLYDFNQGIHNELHLIILNRLLYLYQTALTNYFLKEV